MGANRITPPPTAHDASSEMQLHCHLTPISTNKMLLHRAPTSALLVPQHQPLLGLLHGAATAAAVPALLRMAAATARPASSACVCSSRQGRQRHPDMEVAVQLVQL